jgi:hypothetical protein
MGGQIMLWVYGGYKHTLSDLQNQQAIIQDVSFLLMGILAMLIWSLLTGLIDTGLLL